MFLLYFQSKLILLILYLIQSKLILVAIFAIVSILLNPLETKCHPLILILKNPYAPNMIIHIKTKKNLTHLMNPYRVLRVTPPISAKELKKAYYKRVFDLHPDRIRSLPNLSPMEQTRLENERKEAFLQVVKAYQQLTQPKFDIPEEPKQEEPRQKRRQDPSFSTHDPIFDRYEELLKKHQGPRYMSNGLMFTIIFGIAVAAGLLSIVRARHRGISVQEALEQRDVELEEYYKKVLDRPRKDALAELEESFRRKVSGSSSD